MPRINDPINYCGCGESYLSSHKARHQNTQKHKNWENANFKNPLYIDPHNGKPIYFVIDGLAYGELVHKGNVFCKHCNQITEQYFECHVNTSYCPTCHYCNSRDPNIQGIYSRT